MCSVQSFLLTRFGVGFWESCNSHSACTNIKHRHYIQPLPWCEFECFEIVAKGWGLGVKIKLCVFGESLSFWEGLRSDFWESFRSFTFLLASTATLTTSTADIFSAFAFGFTSDSKRRRVGSLVSVEVCLKPSVRGDGGRKDQGPDCRACKRSVLQGAAECTEPEASARSGSVGGRCRPGFVAGRIGSHRHHHHGAARHTRVAVLQSHSGAAGYPGCLGGFGPAGLRYLRCQCLLGNLVDLQLLQGPSPRRLRPGLLLLPPPPQQFHRLLKLSPPPLVCGLSQCRSSWVIGVGFFGPKLPRKNTTLSLGVFVKKLCVNVELEFALAVVLQCWLHFG